MNMILSWMRKHLISEEAIGDPIDQMVDAFSQITNLKSLDIGNNRITSLPDNRAFTNHWKVCIWI